MEFERHINAKWHWSLLISVLFINIFIPNLLLSYGVLVANAISLGVSTGLALFTPTLFTLTYCLSQCWCREAAESWGGPVGYRTLSALGLALVVSGLILASFLPIELHPFFYGILGGLGSSIISAQVDAVIFDTYDTCLPLIRNLCFCGQAIGQSLFPHIITALIDNYGYSMTYMVLSAVMLQTLPAILLLKVNDSFSKPIVFTRYADTSKSYAIFGNEDANSYELNAKYWNSPDDNLHLANDSTKDNTTSIVLIVTPPPSPEEKRRNLYGVEILPDIPEESEEEDEKDQKIDKRSNFNVALRRFSTIRNNFEDCITNQVRRDSQIDDRKTDVEVTYDSSSSTDVQNEKVFNLGFRCQSAYASMRRRFWMPSYKIYRCKRRLIFFGYSLNDTFIKPLSRSLMFWRFYPALLMCFSRISLTAVVLALLPTIAGDMKPEISKTETNFLMSLHGFTWICFLLSTPWLVQTQKRNFKYLATFGSFVSTAACLVLAYAKNHDTFSIGCVIAGFGYGAITSTWEPAVQDFVGIRKWPKLQSPMETLSGFILFLFYAANYFLYNLEKGLEFCVLILGFILAANSFVWLIISIASFYNSNIKSKMENGWFIR